MLLGAASARKNKMFDNALQLYALDRGHGAALRVASRLGLPLAAHEDLRFADGENKLRALEPVQGRDAVVVHSLYGEPGDSANDKLCRLLFFCASLKDAGAHRVTALMPYLCYSREDRRAEPNDPLTLRYIAALCEAARIDAVLTLDVHDLAAFENAFRIPARNIEAAELLAAHFADTLSGQELIAVSPDAGGIKRAERFRRALERRTGSAVASGYMEKFRARGALGGQTLTRPVQGRAAIIVDDLLSTGATLRRAIDACAAAGAAAIHVAVAHGLFTESAAALLDDARVGQFVLCDSVPPFRLDAPHAARVTILDSSMPLAVAIAALHPGLLHQSTS